MEVLIIVLLLVILVILTLYAGIKTVPEGEVWVVERLGKYSRTLHPGLNFIWPFIETVRAKLSTKDITIDIEPQNVITADNAVIEVDTIVFVKITNPRNAVYGVDDYEEAIKQLTITTLRSVIGEMELDEVFSSRDKIKARLTQEIAEDTKDWGVTLKAFDIQDIKPSESMRQAMEEQAAAERKKRAVETLAEANKKAAILEAEGRLRSAELEAQAQVALAQASAEAMRLIGDNLDGKELPAMFLLGDRYINSLDKMSTSQNAKFVVYPADIQSAIKGLLGNAFKGK